MASCPNCNAATQEDYRVCADCGHHLKKMESSRVAESAMQTVGGRKTLDGRTTRPGRGAPNTAPTLEPGARFADRYIIEEIVGRGGMGVVYKAQDTISDTIVALKLIRQERLAGSDAVKRLIAEGITARDIRHPNIVSVYDVGEAAGQPFVSMEYLSGKSLRTWHRERLQQRADVPLRVAARIVAEILDGLKAAHDSGVIHRDLKPENIVLVDEPDEKSARLKILDFGIARSMGDALDSGTGTGLGTPGYMAPEQITNADSAGAAADLYALSLIFYELLVDVLPVGHWEPPSGGRSDVPHGIDTLIKKGISNRPANRPQSAEAYRKDLVDAVNLHSSKPENGSQTHKNAVNEAMKWITKSPVDNPSIKRKVWKWVGIAFIALILLGMLEAALDPCSEYSGLAYQQCQYLEANSY